MPDSLTPTNGKCGAQGPWSRRINEEHRHFYLVDAYDNVIRRAQYHY
ncbi:type II toxin-antitoxin system YoeB family toxin [Brevibacterium siliguriense]|nr:type II toxin-antitoxin system YoeB family toxin [Brevibacterium siliguriense]